MTAFQKMANSDLPILVLSKIFSFFTVNQKLQARQVCKLWKFLIEQTTQHRLCMYEFQMPKACELRWNDGSKELVNDQDKLYVTLEHNRDFRLDKYFINLFKILRLRLKKIYLYHQSPCSNQLKQIGIFKHLNELVLEQIRHVSLDKLSSSTLQTISFKAVRKFATPLTLDTPNLTRYIFWNCSSAGPMYQIVTPAYPERIVYFECQIFRPYTLPNLEHLICQDICDSVDFRNYPKLRKLEYYPEKSDRTLSRIEILKEHQRNNQNLELFISGYKLDSKFNESPVFFNLVFPSYFLFSIDENFGLFSRNFSKLTNQFPWKFEIDYSALLLSFGGQFPGNFFEIFPNINSVIVDGTHLSAGELDNNKLLDFLNERRGLQILKLLDYPFGADFHRRLSAIRPTTSIAELEIRQSDVVEFEIAKFPNLKDFKLTSNHLSLQMLNGFFERKTLLWRSTFWYSHSSSGLFVKLDKFKEEFDWSLWVNVKEDNKCYSKEGSLAAIDFLRKNERTKSCLV